MSRYILTGFVLSLFLGLGLHAEAADPPPDLGDNAALDYSRAIYWIAHWTPEQQKAVEAFDRVPLDDALVQAAQNGRRPLIFLYFGASHTSCNWGLHLDEEGLSTLLPHLNEIRSLSRLALLRARVEMRDGNLHGAVDDWDAVVRLGRHTQQDAIVTSMLVGYGAERLAIQYAAAQLNQLDQGALNHLAGRLDHLPPGATLAAAVLQDKRIGQAWALRLLSQSSDAQWEQTLARKLDLSDFSLDKIHAMAQACGGTRQSVIDKLHQLDPLFDALEKNASLPYPQALPQWSNLRQQAQANPASLLAGIFDYTMLARMGQITQTQLAMLQASIAILASGQDALKSHRDPLDDSLFAYRALANGFELSSKLLDREGHPVTLTIGNSPSSKP